MESVFNLLSLMADGYVISTLANTLPRMDTTAAGWYYGIGIPGGTTGNMLSIKSSNIQQLLCNEQRCSWGMHGFASPKEVIVLSFTFYGLPPVSVTICGKKPLTNHAAAHDDYDADSLPKG